MELMETLKARRMLINLELDKMLDVGGQERLKSAMRHLPLVETSKRLRPMLAMLCAEAVSEGPSGSEAMKTIPFALALEVIHNFTLVHDDIMDDDQLRRGVKTVHIEYDTPTAINAGDALFARSFEILSKLEVEDKVLRMILHDVARMVREIGEGQQWDLDFGDRMDVSVDEYMNMVELKTARIFQMAAKGGATIGGGTDEQIENLQEYGKLIGVGFQILDDILDFKRDKSLKSAGSDIRQGKRTLMVLHCLEELKDGSDEKSDFLRILGNNDATDDDIERALEIMNSTGSIDFAQEHATKYGNSALDKLKDLPDTESRTILENFAKFMVEGRTF